MAKKVFNIIEKNNLECVITHFVSSDTENESEKLKEAQKLFVDIINEHTSPAILSKESEQFWLQRRVYSNHDYHLYLVESYID